MALEALESRTLLSVCAVDRLTDNNPAGGGEGGNGMGDLRWCVVESLFQADTIDFSVTGTVNLAAVLPTLTRGVTIEGPGTDLLTVRRNTGGDYRIFTVATGVTASISGLTISNGFSGVGNDGGGILNSGTLTLSDSTISSNSASSAGGGGIFNNMGNLTVTNSTISGNSAMFRNGGGIYNFFGSLTVSGGTISGNTDSNFGGGIYNTGTLTLSDSTISGNTETGIGTAGGGIYNGGMAMVSDSTIAGNSITGQGGGIFNGGRLTLSDSTIAGNAAVNGGALSGGGIYVYAGTTMSARNTIIAGNTAPTGPDVYGNFGSQGYNLLGNPQDASGWVDTDLLHVNPQLGMLQDNGGPTRTMALMPGSPALNAGDPTQLGAADQRGVVRSGGVNIGAYQASASAFVFSVPAKVTAGVPFDLTLTAVDPFGQLAAGYTGTMTFSTTDPDPGVVLPADYTFTADDAGVHTFSDSGLGEITLVTHGQQTITAADTADSSITGSAAVKVRHVRHHDGGSPGVPAGQDPAAADRVFAALLPGDVGWLASASRHRNGETGSWDLDVFSQGERLA